MSEQSSGWKIDKTINLPLLLSLLTAVVYVTIRFTTVENDTARAMEKATRVDDAQVSAARATTDQITALRVEFRGDVREVNNKLDQVILRLGETPRNLKEWTK